MATGYVTNWGNDANDGLTWETAKRTFQGALDAGLEPIYAKGWFNERFPNSKNIHGYATITGINSTYSRTAFYSRNNLKIENYNDVTTIYNTFESVIERCTYDYTYIGYNGNKNCLLYNNKLIGTRGLGLLNSTSFNFKTELSIHCLNKYGIQFGSNNIISNKLGIWFYESTGLEFLTYNLFINSPFKLTGGTLGTDETTYTYPTGATDDDKLQTLRNRMATVYGGLPSDYLVGCKYYSRNAPDGQEEVEPYASAYKDIFIDADNGNFYLKEDSIAAHMAFDGSYVGAKPVGQQIALSDFALTNIDANGKVTDQETDALAQRLNVTDLLKLRKILSWTALGERAARNGQQINTESNLGLPISAGTGVLTALKTYMVINDVITLDNAAATSYNPWETFQAIDEGGGAGLGFSTSNNGQVQEVLIEKYDEKITVKSSKDNPALTGANTLTFYLHEQPKVNLDTNGIAIAGNADATFDPATAVDFYTRYITLDIQIKANNLPAR